jgi:O-antigen/teichoic acid export membrane protein
MQLLYTHVDPLQEEVFALLMLSFIPLSLNYVFGTLLTAGGRMQLMNLLAVVGLGINLALNFWLIPLLGAKGAAIATLATQSFVFGAQWLSCYRWQQWRFDGGFALRLVGFLATALLSNHLLHPLAPGWGLAGSLASGGLLLLLFFGKPVYQVVLDRLKDQINGRN